MKAVKHKPTLAPSQCDCCLKIWYGMGVFTDTRVTIPTGIALCYRCWIRFDDYTNTLGDWEEINSRDDSDDQRWKKGYPQFFEAAKLWVQKAAPKKRRYRGVPEWMRVAVDSGKVVPNDEYVYTITSCGDRIMQVVKTSQSSITRYE